MKIPALLAATLLVTLSACKKPADAPLPETAPTPSSAPQVMPPPVSPAMPDAGPGNVTPPAPLTDPATAPALPPATAPKYAQPATEQAPAGRRPDSTGELRVAGWFCNAFFYDWSEPRHLGSPFRCNIPVSALPRACRNHCRQCGNPHAFSSVCAEKRNRALSAFQ